MMNKALTNEMRLQRQLPASQMCYFSYRFSITIMIIIVLLFFKTSRYSYKVKGLF